MTKYKFYPYYITYNHVSSIIIEIKYIYYYCNELLFIIINHML
jgi:hypothetical protein